MLDISVKQMRYAVEIAHCGSINQAAQNLYVTQSSLSKAMKELESTLGYAVFQRTPAGTTVTEEGQPFLEIAQQVVYKLELLERQSQQRNEQLAAMKISIPRATYITYAFTEFFKKIQNREQIQINFSETNSQEAIDNILSRGFQLGIIRYPEFMEENTRRLLHQKHLRVRPIWTFSYMLLVSGESPLAAKDKVSPKDLIGYTELVHGDEESAFLPEPAGGAERKRIYLYERGSQFDLLANVPSTYMWVSPIPQKLLDKNQLIQRSCKTANNLYKDVMIFREDYHFSEYDRLFQKKLYESKVDVSTMKL